MPAFLVGEAEAEAGAGADAEVAEMGAALVERATDVPVNESAEELPGLTADEAEDETRAAVLLEAQTTESGTVTPAVVQICLAYVTARAWSDSVQAPVRQHAMLPRKLWLLQIHWMSKLPHEPI